MFLYRDTDRKKAKCNFLWPVLVYSSGNQTAATAVHVSDSNWGTVMSPAASDNTNQLEALFSQINITYSGQSKPTNNLFRNSLVGN